MKTNCIICDKQVTDPKDFDSSPTNPFRVTGYSGGFVEITFGFGSRCDNPTTHCGLICDDCAAKVLLKCTTFVKGQETTYHEIRD